MIYRYKSTLNSFLMLTSSVKISDDDSTMLEEAFGVQFAN